MSRLRCFNANSSRLSHLNRALDLNLSLLKIAVAPLKPHETHPGAYPVPLQHIGILAHSCSASPNEALRARRYPIVLPTKVWTQPYLSTLLRYLAGRYECKWVT